MKKIIFGAAVIIAAIVLIPAFSSAQTSTLRQNCTPVVRTAKNSFTSADIVFSGWAVGVTTSTDTINNDGERISLSVVTSSYQVDKSWKGNPPKVIKIKSSVPTGSGCPAFTPKIGEIYFIYAKQDPVIPGIYHVTASDAKSRTEAMEDLAKLGYGRIDIGQSSVAKQTFPRNLSVGSNGQDVTLLQKWLEQKGFLVIPPGISRGYFGGLTKTALIKYQEANVLKPANGLLAGLTRQKLNEAYEKAPVRSPEIVPIALADAFTNVYYTQTLDAVNFPASTISWSLNSGTMPSGFFLEKGQNDSFDNPMFKATIGGLPKKKGTYNFTVKATNGKEEAVKSYSLRVLPGFSIETDKPSYNTHEHIQIKLIAHNPSPDLPKFMKFEGSCQTSYRINNLSGVTVYDSVASTPCTSVGSEIIISPLEKQTWTLTHSSQSFRIPPGRYKIEGQIYGYARVESEVITITQ